MFSTFLTEANNHGKGKKIHCSNISASHSLFKGKLCSHFIFLTHHLFTPTYSRCEDCIDRAILSHTSAVSVTADSAG